MSVNQLRQTSPHNYLKKAFVVLFRFSSDTHIVVDQRINLNAHEEINPRPSECRAPMLDH